MSEARDPVCGSGNFLGDSMHRLINSQRKIIFAADVGLPSFFPKVGPEQVLGIEINECTQSLPRRRSGSVTSNG